MADSWDAFLSYASEDRDAVAQPLYDALTSLGLRIWFDKTELKVGDSLRDRIDDGLARCRFGIVVLSPAFFGKHYPTRELNGLAQREVDGKKVILPVWHELDVVDVRKYSPPMADRIAARTSEGIEAVAADLVVVIRPELIQEWQAAARTVRHLPEIASGRQLFDLMANVHAHQPFTDEVIDKEEAQLIGGFESWVAEIGDFADDMNATQKYEMQIELTEELERLNGAGWRVFGERRAKKIKFGAEETLIDVAIVATLKNARGAATVAGGHLVIAREEGKKNATDREEAT